MSILLESKLLRVAAQTIESHLTPETRAEYTEIVAAGTETPPYQGPNGLYRKPNGCLAWLKDSKDPISQCVNDAINLCFLTSKRCRRTMPIKAIVPAAMTLALKALDFADQIGIVKIGNAELVQATHRFTDAIFQRLGMTPQMIHSAAAKVHSITQDPAAMEQINQRAGITKAPGASVPARWALRNEQGQGRRVQGDPCGGAHAPDVSLCRDERTGELRELVFVSRGKIGQGLDAMLHDLGIKLSRAIQSRDPDTGLDHAVERANIVTASD